MSGFKKTVAFALVAILIGAFGYGAASVVSDKVVAYKEARDPNWNKRGYIRCVDGRIEIGNIDISAPAGEWSPIVDLSKITCGEFKPEAGK